MTKTQTIHLGFEVGSGEAVSIPVSHLCVTGQTQLSGKTTTLEALISRSGLKAIAFVTKRGEAAFGVNGWSVVVDDRDDRDPRIAASIPPFFRHKADWQFVGALLGAVLNEKLKYERYWLMNICRGANTLDDVRRDAQKWLDKTKKSEDVRILTTILAYFDLFMDELEALPFTDKLKLQPGLNVMDLSAYSLPLQMLVISAVVEEVYERHKGVITIIPEAWEFIPNGKNSPAKAAVRGLVRKGAALKNFVWTDSQDLAGMDSEIRRQVTAVLLLGVQRDQNEVKRTLEHVPKLPAKLKAEDIMTLERGQFWAAFGTTVKRVYVQPAWMSDELAREVAMGNTTSVPDREYKVSASGHVTAPPMLAYLAERLDKIEPKDIANPDAEVEYSHSRITDAIATAIDNDNDEREADEVDKAEREKYETEISRLNAQVTRLIHDLEGQRSGREFDRLTAPKTNGNGLDLGALTADVTYDLVNSDAFLDVLTTALIPRLPAGGTIKVEPREVVLREFQSAQVKRILEAAAGLTPFQKQVIRFMEARGARATKKDIFTVVIGKPPSGGEGQASRYKQIDELVSAGFLRPDSGFVYANLSVVIKSQIAAFEPTNEAIDDIIGQVMLKLK